MPLNWISIYFWYDKHFEICSNIVKSKVNSINRKWQIVYYKCDTSMSDILIKICKGILRQRFQFLIANWTFKLGPSSPAKWSRKVVQHQSSSEQRKGKLKYGIDCRRSRLSPFQLPAVAYMLIVPEISIILAALELGSGETRAEHFWLVEDS